MKNFFTILGGMGTMATENFIHLLNQRTAAHSDQDYLNYILVNHATIPDRTAHIIDPTKPDPIPLLLEDIAQQSSLKPNFMVLTCNTTHYCYDALQQATTVPILHMPREAIRELLRQFPKGGKKIAVLATEGSIRTKVYEKELAAQGFTAVIPEAALQQKVTDLIYRDVKENNFLNEALYKEILQDVMIQQGCDVAILGCTELSLVQEHVKQKHSYAICDAESVLVDRTIALALEHRAEGK